MTAILNQIRFLKSAQQTRDFPPDAGAEVAFAGRSNAGKSSALNRITGIRGLARTSKTPGRTQLVNFFVLDEERRLVDLPGYGFARVPAAVKRQWQTLLEDYLLRRQALRGLVLLMDIRHPLTPFDRQMLAWVQPHGLPVHVLLTKADKLSRGRGLAVTADISKELAGTASVQAFSALSGLGVEAANDRIVAWLGAVEKKTPVPKGEKHRG